VQLRDAGNYLGPPSTGGLAAVVGYAALAAAALAAGDVATARDATEAWPHLIAPPRAAAVQRAYRAMAALARGDLLAGRRWADDTVQTTTGWHLVVGLTTRARVAIAQGEPEQAERDAHDALGYAAEVGAYLPISDKAARCLSTHHRRRRAAPRNAEPRCGHTTRAQDE
jgi:hypothetical protein